MLENGVRPSPQYTHTDGLTRIVPIASHISRSNLRREFRRLGYTALRPRMDVMAGAFDFSVAMQNG